jgi:hypothetical protein
MSDKNETQNKRFEMILQTSSGDVPFPLLKVNSLYT